MYYLLFSIFLSSDCCYVDIFAFLFLSRSYDCVLLSKPLMLQSVFTFELCYLSCYMNFDKRNYRTLSSCLIIIIFVHEVVSYCGSTSFRYVQFPLQMTPRVLILI